MGPHPLLVSLAILHILLHFLVPGGIALVFFRSRWKTIWLVMVLTLLVDLDHLLATPVYDPCRCSIGYHPLHSWAAIAGYALCLAAPRLRIVSLGLLIHMALDWLDCARMV